MERPASSEAPIEAPPEGASSPLRRPASSDAPIEVPPFSLRGLLKASKLKQKTTPWNSSIAKVVEKPPRLVIQVMVHATDSAVVGRTMHLLPTGGERVLLPAFQRGINPEDPPSLDTLCKHLKTCLHVHYTLLKSRTKASAYAGIL